MRLPPLVGVPAPQFAIEPKVLDTQVPAIPLGLPSDVLQRRPDIASAERAMAAANAQIGVAKAAFFPSLTLTPSIGWESTQFASLFSAPTLMWTLGAASARCCSTAAAAAANVQVRERRLQGHRGELPANRAHRFQQVQDGITGSPCWTARRSSRSEA
jgi:Outer membrane protein